jgi:hypothetical protein
MSSQEMMLNGAIATAVGSATATEVLQRLQVVPGAKEALDLLRQRVPGDPDSKMQEDLISALRGVHQRLLAEGSPDYWIEDLPSGITEVDMDQMDLAVEAASTRLNEAAFIAELIEMLDAGESERYYVVAGSSPTS